MENKSYDYKSTDYDDYKNYVKYAANGVSVMMPDKESVSRIKRKYMRIWECAIINYYNNADFFNFICYYNKSMKPATKTTKP